MLSPSRPKPHQNNNNQQFATQNMVYFNVIIAYTRPPSIASTCLRFHCHNRDIYRSKSLIYILFLMPPCCYPAATFCWKVSTAYIYNATSPQTGAHDYVYVIMIIRMDGKCSQAHGHSITFGMAFNNKNSTLWYRFGYILCFGFICWVVVNVALSGVRMALLFVRWNEKCCKRLTLLKLNAIFSIFIHIFLLVQLLDGCRRIDSEWNWLEIRLICWFGLR